MTKRELGWAGVGEAGQELVRPGKSWWGRAGPGTTAGHCVRRLRAISVRELELSDGVPVADKISSCPGEKKSGLPGTKMGSNVPGE